MGRRPLGEQVGADGADLDSAGQHQELRRRGEYRGQVGEVPSAETTLGLRTDVQERAVGLEIALGDQVFEDLAGALIEHRKITPPAAPLGGS